MVYPKRVADQVVRMARDIGIEYVEAHKTVTEGGRSPREYLIELRHGERSGVVRVANFEDARTLEFVYQRGAEWTEESAICDLYEGLAASDRMPASRAIDAIAEWANLDHEKVRARLGWYEERSKIGAEAGQIHFDRVRDATVARALQDPVAVDDVINQAFKHRRNRRGRLMWEVAVGVVHALGLGRAVEAGFSGDFSTTMRFAVREAAIVLLRDAMDGVDAPGERSQQIAWDTLRELPLAIRVLQAELLFGARGSLGETIPSRTAVRDSARGAIALRVATPIHLAAVVLPQLPNGVGPWAWVSEVQDSMHVFGGSEPAVLEPFRSDSGLRRLIAEAARGGTISVPVPRPVMLG